MPKNCIVKNKKLKDKEKCYLNFGSSSAGYCCSPAKASATFLKKEFDILHVGENH